MISAAGSYGGGVAGVAACSPLDLTGPIGWAADAGCGYVGGRIGSIVAKPLAAAGRVVVNGISDGISAVGNFLGI